MSIVEVHLPNIENFGETPPYTETEILSKDYQDDFLVPGDDKHFLVLDKEKAWLVHADSLGAVAEELEGYLGMSVNDFVIISLGSPEHQRFCIEKYHFWEALLEKLREVYYTDWTF
ncbi:hypothetical protein HCC60_07725 [Streptococcus suis]|nr:hypothetical protein [Streptococcus suis]